jgi:hypothetical protein
MSEMQKYRIDFYLFLPYACKILVIHEDVLVDRITHEGNLEYLLLDFYKERVRKSGGVK